MPRTHLTAIVFICLLAGHEAARVSETEELTEAVQQQQETPVETPDLDWPGCGRNQLFCSAEGCRRQYVWLDTPRQSCRFTDDYKLTHDTEKFLKVELARLEEKSATFARTGCLFGSLVSWSSDTYMWKCVRRMNHISRLTRFVRKVVKAARRNPTHPAREYATSTTVEEALQRVGDNIATGFEKYERKGGTGLSYAEAWRLLLDTKEAAQQRRDACTNTNCTPTVEEESEEQANITAAMLEMVGVHLTDGQRSTLQDRMACEDVSDARVSDDEEEKMLDAMDADVQRTDLAGGLANVVKVMPLSADQRAAFQEAVGDEVEAETNSSALVQVSTGEGKVTSGGGPLRWLWDNGLGWVVTRIAWLLMFVMGVALNVIVRGGGLVLSLIGCVLKRSLQWVFGDVIYRWGWKGNTRAMERGFGQIGQCSPWAWNLVGFDRRHDGPLGPLVLDPARFASGVTGVESFESCWVDCGPNTVCKQERCFCRDGHYPSKVGPGCALMQTVKGCVCKDNWTKTKLIGGRATYHGCSPNGDCKVDQTHDSYDACKAALKSDFYGYKRYDSCIFQVPNAEVAQIK